jgi:hypothetical protein
MYLNPEGLLESPRRAQPNPGSAGRNPDTVRPILDTFGALKLLAIATSGAENEIDCGASELLEFGIVFTLTDSCQATIEGVSRQ